MKNKSSHMVLRLCVMIVVMLVFLSKTLSSAEKSIESDLVENIKEEKIELGVELKEEYVMPTYDTIECDNSGYKHRVKGTDKWNDVILKVSKEENIDPIFVKCVMALESAGEAGIVNHNSNNTSDYGLMQVNTGWGNSFDYSLMLSDPEYAIRSGIKVIKNKVDAALKNGKVPTVHEVAWRYNGYTERGNRYANKFVLLYEDMSKTDSNKSILMENNF